MQFADAIYGLGETVCSKDVVVDTRPDAEQHRARADAAGGRQIVVDDHEALAQHFDLAPVAARLVESAFEGRQDVIAHVLRREHRITDQAVAHLAGQRGHARLDRGHVDRHAGARLRRSARKEVPRLDAVERALVAHLAAGRGRVHDEPQHFDVFAHLADRLTHVAARVPVVVAVRRSHAQPETEAPPTQQVDVQGLVGEHDRAVVEGQHHARADVDPLDLRRNGGQRDQRGIGQFRGPQRVESRGLVLAQPTEHVFVGRGGQEHGVFHGGSFSEGFTDRTILEILPTCIPSPPDPKPFEKFGDLLVPKFVEPAMS